MNNEATTTNDPVTACRMSLVAWKSASGYPDPYVCEISPMQYAYLSKRAKAQYDENRRQEWDASAAGAAAYAALVIGAFDAGLIDRKDDALSRDARDVLSGEIQRRDMQAKKDAEKAARKALELAPEDLVVGLEVFHPVYRECVISKVNRKSVILTFADGSTIKAGNDWLSRRS